MNIAIPAISTKTSPLNETEKLIFREFGDMRRVEAYDSAGQLKAVIYMRESREAMQFVR
jgi:hypothetical protein